MAIEKQLERIGLESGYHRIIDYRLDAQVGQHEIRVGSWLSREHREKSPKPLTVQLHTIPLDRESSAFQGAMAEVYGLLMTEEEYQGGEAV